MTLPLMKYCFYKDKNKCHHDNYCSNETPKIQVSSSQFDAHEIKERHNKIV
jgi:hypothetical protein